MKILTLLITMLLGTNAFAINNINREEKVTLTNVPRTQGNAIGVNNAGEKDWIRACPKLAQQLLGNPPKDTNFSSFKYSQGNTIFDSLLKTRDLQFAKFPGVKASTTKQKQIANQLSKVRVLMRIKPEDKKLIAQATELQDKLDAEEENIAKLKREFGSKNIALISELRAIREQLDNHHNFQAEVKSLPVTLVKSFNGEKPVDVYFSNSRLLGYRLRKSDGTQTIVTVNPDCSQRSSANVKPDSPYDYFEMYDPAPATESSNSEVAS